MLPSRSFTLERQAGELRTRTLRDPIGTLAVKRLAAFLYGYQLSPAEPWTQPHLLARDPSTEEALWFERCEIIMHANFSGPTSPIATNLFEASLDLVAFGSNALFKPRKKGRPPRLQSLPLMSCYVDEDSEGRTDTLYRPFKYSARRAGEEMLAKGWKSAKLAKKVEENPRAQLSFLHAIDPRAGGEPGAIRSRKPFHSTVIWLDENELMEDDGWDRMPIQFARFERRSGEVYGSGPSWDAYPAVYSCNAIADSIIRGGELMVDPILFGNTAIFGGKLDRRPGAFNALNGPSLFGRDVNQMIGKLDLGGDVRMGVELLRAWRSQVESMFYIDWLDMNEGPQKTATEIIDRRDMRLRMLAPVSARMEQEWLNPLVEDFFFGMLDAGMFPPPPQSLQNEEIGFSYRSPLALAQRGQHVDAIQKTFQLAAQAQAIDPTAAQVIKADEALRKAARYLGLSEKDLRPFEELEASRQAQAQQQQDQHEAQLAQMGGAALQQGAQGIASLSQLENQAGAADVPLRRRAA